MSFQIRSLEETEFAVLFNLDDQQLEQIGAKRMIADKKPGYPCRVSLQDAEIGEEVILLTYEHHKTGSPYRASGPVYVRKRAKTAALRENEIPEMLGHRLLSLRGYDNQGMMKAALVLEGKDLREEIDRLFEDQEIDYLHIHNAKAGCYNCLVERAGAQKKEIGRPLS